ncbi:signal recognition particle-docking protein FtsY [Leptolyngbya sp. NK1-12]|uniref:Signal recognition particle receptor FtsY n=1 Tax=Leptolyngbya sp. NK1-12 TaxID=2547451 RepID=A0AA97AM54_9CYAN|nr:signal recognition particle-docking protein FtsY [Leptolyngbya sp. NK1-12]WNZ25382.1 signal recognition particle-docking protein FtsY [Leptolyngbya sp. NK1-12]
MGSFNWFNRQYDDKPAAEDEAAQQEATTESATQAAESGTQSAAEEAAVNEDYLSWAKAAYANIRKRQQEETEPAADEGAPESVAEAPLTESAAEPAELETEPETPETPSPEASPEPTAAPAALPFWMQAETERLARLERLKAEAEQEAEAEQAAQSTQAPAAPVEPTETIPDFVLDEAFVWSAEVLAAQGRRPDQVSIEEITWLKRLRQGLDKTRRGLVNQLRSIVGQGPLNQDAVMEIEALLLQADVGVEATDYIIESLQNKLKEEALPPQEAISYLKSLLRDMLDKPLGDSHSLSFVPEKDKLNIWLITGVNGAGKTTTIGKLAHIAQKSGYRCLIAAADTFRAAAVQQVKVWGERSQVEVIANPGKNTDPAAVVFDAIAAAESRDTELLLVDTAGRLQNKKNLMEELSKIRRIIDKKAPDANVESLLVLDATLGQNGLRQAEVFSEVAKLSGVVLTKLDGTAKGGIALAVVQQLGLPIRFIGAGEGIEDLRPFSSYEFVEALLSG